MSKFRSGVSGSGRKSTSRRTAVSEEQTAHCSTSHFQPDATYGDCDDTSQFMPGSLAGMSPSSRGHTMKECEEQLSQLHKENFNLKLRIYFLEERLGHRGPSAAPPPGSDTAEMESLRTELADKQRLLCQAATAIDLVERRHREEVERLEAGAAADRAELEGRLAQLQKTYSERCQQLEAKVTRGGQRAETTSAGTQCDDDRADVAERVDDLSRQLEARGQQLADAEQRIRGLEEALCEKQPEIQIKVQELRERDNIIEEKQNQIEQQNRVLVEIQITLAEKQRLIDALNAAIAARDVTVARLGAELEAARAAAEARLAEEARELSRARGENEMLKTQLGRRMNRGGGRDEAGGSPRRRGNGGRSRDSVSPRNKSLIEEAIEGIWSTPVFKTRDELLPSEEKENVWKLNDSKEKFDRALQLQVVEGKPSEKFSEEDYLKLEKEHRRGCEAIQGFVARIKSLAAENDAARRDSKRLRLELRELRDSYNKAKWEARQLEADATGVPGTLADVRDMTEEENERLWAEVEDKNKKLAQLSIEMEKQIQALLTSLKEKEAKLLACETKLSSSEVDLLARDKYVKELEKKLSRLHRSPFDVVIDNSAKNINNDTNVKKSALDNLFNNATLDDLQASLDVILKRRETEMFSLRSEVEIKDLKLGLFAEKVAELGVDRAVALLGNERSPVNFIQHVHLQQAERSANERSLLSGTKLKGTQWTKEEQQLFMDNLEGLGDGRAIRSQCDRLQDELRASEIARKNATNACGLLVGRLEELAGFLVSLLRRPGRLETTHCRFIRQAVQRSVDLSRQLSASVSLLPDEGSLTPDANLSLVGRYLDGSSAVEEIPVTSCSTETLEEICGLDERPASLDDCARVIARLRSQVDALKLEIRQRDIELDCLVREHDLIKLSSTLFDASDRPLSSMTFYGVSTDHARLPEVHSRTNQDAAALSESETWSEPDRRISLARIGLRAEENTPTNNARHHRRTLDDESSGSSQETARETVRTPGKPRAELRRLQAKLRGLEQVNEALRTELAILHQVTPISHHDSPDDKTLRTIEEPADDRPVVIPSHLLEQIRRQREKLESSLFHNDFIRRQLEGVFLSASGGGAKLDGLGADLLAIEAAQAKLGAAEKKAGELEERLREAEASLREAGNGATRLADTERRCDEMREKIVELEAIMRERDAEVSELQERATTQEAELHRMVRERDAEVSELRERATTQEAELHRMVRERDAEVTELRERSTTQEAEVHRIVRERDAEVTKMRKRATTQEAELHRMVRERDAEVTELREKATTQKEELLRMVREMSELRAESERRVAQAEERLREAKGNLLRKVEEMEKEMASYEKRSKDSEAELKEAKGNLNEALMQKAEANKIIEMMKVEFSARVRAFEETQRGLEARIERAKEEGNRETERRSRKLEEAEQQLEELRAEIGRKVEAAERRSTEAGAREAGLRTKVEEGDRRTRRERDEAALAASKAALESTRAANEKLRLEQELRGLEATLSRERDEAEGRLAALRRHQADLEARARDLEVANADLRLQLERMSASREAWGATSPPPAYAHHRSEPRDNGYTSGRGGWNPDARPRSPDSCRSPLSSLVLQRGFGRQHSEFSDYVSEDQDYETVVTRSSSYWITTVTGGARNAHSPDLGIESDQGRFSSLEANADHERRRPMEVVDGQTSAVQTFRRGRSNHNCSAIEEKNGELKRELCQTRRALEDTLAQLTAANHRKQNVEKAICKQIEKTCSLLQETRGNLQPEHLMLCDDRT